jgi:SAP domain
VSPDRIDAPEGGWESLKVDELKEQLEARDLPKAGKKDELVARLEEHDAAPPAEEAEEAAPQSTTRRRGSAETTTTQPKRAAAARPDGELIVRARSKYVRSAPRKARLVMGHIRGKEVE